MNPTPTLSAKDRVLAWVRDANPQTITERYAEGCQKYSAICGKKSEKGTWYCETCKEWNGEDRYVQDFADMGLQELLIAANSLPQHHGELENDGDGDAVFCIYKDDSDGYSHYLQCEITFDLTQNLHNQPEPFYESLLPLIPNA